MNPSTLPPSDNSHDSHGNPPATERSNAHSPEKRRTARGYAKYLWVGGALVVMCVAILLYVSTTWSFAKPFTGLTYTVKKDILRMTIVERGNLESAENSDIVCRVKAGSKGSTIASTIKWVIEDGTQVKAGELIVELDDSGFQEQLKTQRNTVNKAFSDWVQANADSTIQASQNVSDVKTSEVNLIQAQLELKKYAGDVAGSKMVKLETHDQVRGYLTKEFEDDVRKESSGLSGKFTSAYLQDVSSYEGTIETARSDKDSWMDRASWSQRMVKKGFYSLSQADADQLRLESMKIVLRKAEGDLDIYRIFEREKNITKKWSDVKEAERALKRVDIQATYRMKQKAADEASKKAINDQEADRLHDLEKEEKYYRIVAPQDGLIVYYIPEQARFGGGSQQSTVAQGEPVREGQKLIRIPNLSKMMVSARVHEAMVSKLKGERFKPTGYSDQLRSSFSFGRNDLFALASYQVAFEGVRNEFKDKDQVAVTPGEPAAIRVDAYPGRQYLGRVKTVATVASQADFLSSDVKLYQTMVSIDNLDNEKLKPGMSAEVTILADEIKHPVLVIPIQAVVGNVAMGAERKCYVLDGGGYPKLVDIVVGKSNDKLVEIKSGVQEGDKVVLNPRSLIPEKSDMKASTPGARRGVDFEGDAGKKGSGKKRDGAGKKDVGNVPQAPIPDAKSFQQRSETVTPAPKNRDASTLKKSS